jgi:hydrogenase-4 component F
MFFGAGNAMHVYDTKEMSQMGYVMRALPFMGGVWLAGAFAITGAPPFALFLSEFTILRGGMSSENTWAVFVMALLLIIIFCGFLSHFWKMYFTKSDVVLSSQHKISKWCIYPMVLALIPLLILGLWWPQELWNYFAQITLQLGMGKV